MSWFVLSLLYVILGSSANILRKILLRDVRSDAVGSAVLFQFMGTIIVAIFAIWHGFTFPPISKYPINFILNASLWGLSTLGLFKAYQYIEASEVTILLTFESVVTILAAIVFLHEKFTSLNVVGTVFIILAVVYMSQTSTKLKFNKGVLYALGSGILAGFAIVNDTFMLKHADTLSYLTVGFFLPGLFILLLRPKVVTKMKPLLQFAVLKKNALFTLIYTIGGIFFYLAISRGGEASQVNTIAQANVVVTVLLAALFLNERDHIFKKFVCAILVTIGVLLL